MPGGISVSKFNFTGSRQLPTVSIAQTTGSVLVRYAASVYFLS
jgi:hypothetical protein